MKIRRRIRDERGVAMVTVLFIAAALTVVSSAAGYITIQEFRSSGADARGDQALGYAEAGVDRLMLLIRGGAWNWDDVMLSGCDDPDGNGDPTDDDDADGEFGATPTDDLVFVAGAVTGTKGTYRAEARRSVCPAPDNVPRARNPQNVSVFSTGEHPTARRIVEQVLELRPKGLPIGLYASSKVTSGGGLGNDDAVQQVSLISEGTIHVRDRIQFVGDDPFYTQDDFYNNGVNSPMPAAAHALGDIFCFQKSASVCGTDQHEHVGGDHPINCTANPGPDVGQSAWDGSGKGGEVTSVPAACVAGAPPTTKFDLAALRRVSPSPALEQEDIDTMIERAKTAGLYCFYSGANGQCSINGGVPFPEPQFNDQFFSSGRGAALPDHFVAYFDFPEGTNPAPTHANNTVDWNADISPLCDPAGGTGRSVVMLIPNGSMDMEGGNSVAGAIFAWDGFVDINGGAELHGTILADEIRMQGTSNFLLDDCWLDNMPFAFLQVNPRAWHQIDS